MSEPNSEYMPPLQVLHQLPPMPGHPCAYLPGQVARDRGFSVGRMNPDSWEMMLEAGWRRAGMMIYEPACPYCRQCVPIRLPVDRFKPTRTQRRIARRNSDLEVRITPVQTTDERAELYRRYITTRHNGMMTGSRREFEQFLGMTPVNTCEIEYRQGSRLVAVATTDVTPGAWSAVYCYFDPEEPRRSLGSFNIMKTVELCRDRAAAGDRAKVYLGYWVPGSTTMAYKSRFRAAEALDTDGRWREITKEEANADFFPRQSSSSSPSS
ncbi:MAG: arginyltransferase [Phycisphaerales bacterium]